MNKYIYRTISSLFVAALLVAGCDSDSSSPDTTATTTISGRVTDDASFGKQGDVNDASVRAEEIDENGTIQPSEGQATTDASGRYFLETSVESDIIIIIASKSGFEGRTVATANTAASGSGAVTAMNINGETTAETDVFVVAKQQDGDDEPVTPADVALFVDGNVAADLEDNDTTPTQISTAIRSAIEAEFRHMQQASGESDATIGLLVSEKASLFGQLQNGLNANSTSQTRANALVGFESGMSSAHARVGIDAQASAQARQVARVTLEAMSSGLSSDARFALRQRANLLEADATSQAIITAFQQNSTAAARASLVADAATSLGASLQDADSDSELAEAWSEFEVAVSSQVSTGLNLGIDLSSLIRSRLNVARSSFAASLSSAATNVNAIVSAKRTFETNARTAIESSAALQASSSGNVAFAANVLTLVSAR